MEFAMEEIIFSEITLFHVVGKGSFGTVRKGKWRSKDVAVKVIETEQEKNAFVVEVRQLSRVKHPNIVNFYGACTKPPVVCLVMEYAEGGSLYNVLHQKPQPSYTAAHAISWSLQCASGVAYLHNMKPKALIHRDLKPPNMLLIMGGTVLKICDFGTACDLQTFMTNSKGSAAWMAPEVFESSNYSEKCDVFSWGIILWQILTRRKPFNEIGGPAFRIMWAVHSGTRPPLIQGCPKPLETIMTRCWDKDPALRPSMSEVEEKLRFLSKFFKGGDQPITVTPSDCYATEEEEEEDESLMEAQEHFEMGSMSSTCLRVNHPPTLPPLPMLPPLPPLQISSLSGSVENLPTPVLEMTKRSNNADKRKSTDLSIIEEQKAPPKMGHRRTGSCGTPAIVLGQEPNVLRTGSRDSLLQEVLNNTNQMPPLDLEHVENIRKSSWPSNSSISSNDETLFEFNAHLLLEPKYQPLPPAPSCPESIQVFEQHKRMAKEFLQVQTEIQYLMERRKELDVELNVQITPEYELRSHAQLLKEKEALLEFRHNLKKQLTERKGKQQKGDKSQPVSDEWVLVDKQYLEE